MYLDIEKGYKLGYIWGQKRRRVERLGHEALVNQGTIARNRGLGVSGIKKGDANTTSTKPEVIRVQRVARLSVFFDEGQV
jgi:hypothetical protein